MAIRITYDSNNIDLLVAEEGLRPAYTQDRKQNRAGSGKIEQINFHGIQELQFTAYFTEAIYRSLLAWFSWARQGKLWSFAMDSGAVGNTTLDDAAAADQKVIPLTATAAFSVGDDCLIKQAGDDAFEHMEIASISAGVSVTAVGNLIFAYAAADTFRHLDYWPEVISLDKEFDPRKTGSYYKHTFKFAEAL